MQVNPNHIVAQYERAWLCLKTEIEDEAGVAYVVCGEVTVTPFYVFARGHSADTGTGWKVVPSITFQREDVHLIQDMSHAECEIHNEISDLQTVDEESSTER